MTKSYHTGYDAFQLEPGDKELMKCKICGVVMEVTRDCVGPTSAIGGMAGMKHKHDLFICKNSGEDWHNQAYALLKFIEDTPSGTLSLLVEKEMKAVVKNKKITKHRYKMW